MFYKGKVISVTSDTDDAERIKVKIDRVDDRSNEIYDAFPILPKVLHIKPKVGECVLVFCDNDNPNDQRYYLGPIISQYQHMFKDQYDFGARKFIGGKGDPDTAITNIAKTHGAFVPNEDIAIYGRKNSDIILGDSDIRIRCGAHLVNKLDTTDIGFNRNNPSFIKLKYHETPKTMEKPYWKDSDIATKKCDDPLESSLNLVAQEINLISTGSGDPNLNVGSTDFLNMESKNVGEEGIKDEDLVKFIKEAHPVPYGDVLLKFLYVFMEAFKNHTHRYHQMVPIPDITYNSLMNFDLNTILSKNVRLN